MALLAGGAVVNVAIGWSLALWQWPPLDLMITPERESFWPEIDAQAPAQALPIEERKWMRRHSFDEWLDHVRYRAEDATTGFRYIKYARTLAEYWEGDALWRIDCGWPMPSFSGPHDRLGEGSLFPYPVRWGAFTVNTIVFALLIAVSCLVFSLFWRAISATRRTRASRGLCEKCAYPIGESPVCTECGAVVRPRNGQ